MHPIGLGVLRDGEVKGWGEQPSSGEGLWVRVGEFLTPHEGRGPAGAERKPLRVDSTLLLMQASARHWAAAGSWGLPVPPGAGGHGDGAVQVRAAATAALPGMGTGPRKGSRACREGRPAGPGGFREGSGHCTQCAPAMVGRAGRGPGQAWAASGEVGVDKVSSGEPTPFRGKQTTAPQLSCPAHGSQSPMF